MMSCILELKYNLPLLTTLIYLWKKEGMLKTVYNDLV